MPPRRFVQSRGPAWVRSVAGSESPTLSSLPRDGYVGQSESVEQLQDTHSGPRDSACGNRAQPSGPRSGRPGYRLIASFTQRATERGTSHSTARRLSRILVVRRSRAARLGGARFDAQYVDVDQAMLVSVEL